MRTLPANFSTGFSGNYRMCWVMKIAGGSGNLYYTTANKNSTENTMTLYDGGVVSFNSGILARKINNRNVSAISEIEQSVNILEGGGSGSFSGFTIKCLNQGRLDQDIISSTNLNLENCPTTLYLGFIPTGASPQLNIADCIILWKGVVGTIQYDLHELYIEFKDDLEFKHTDIPKTLIDKETYPRAPNDSIGQPLPILYGDFLTGNATNKYYAQYNVAPTVCIDSTINKFCLAGHNTYDYDRDNQWAFFHDGGMKNLAEMMTLIAGAPTYAIPYLNVGTSSVEFLPGTIIGVIFHPLSYAGENNNITDFYNAVDNNDSTYASIDNTTNKVLELCLDGLPSGATPKLLTVPDHDTYIYGRLSAAIASNQSFVVYFVNDAGVAGSKIVVPTGTSFSLDVGTLELDDISEMSKYTWRFADNSSYTPAAETAKLLVLGVYYSFIIASNIGEAEIPAWTGKPPHSERGRWR